MASVSEKSSRHPQASTSSVGDSVSHNLTSVSGEDTAATLRNSESETGRIRFPPNTLASRNRHGYPKSSPSSSQWDNHVKLTERDQHMTDSTKDYSAGSIGLSQLESSTARYSEVEHLQTIHSAPPHREIQPTQNTAADADTQAQLAWLGYTQELNRNWDFWPVFSLSFCNIGIVGTAFIGLYSSLIAGGLIVMTWGLIIGSLFSIGLTAVMAEVASAYPVSGAMFTWTFKLARSHPYCRNWANFLSWIVGWMMLVSIVFSQVQIALQFTIVVTSGVRASWYLWDFQTWHSYLIASANILFCGLIVRLPQSRSPNAWNMAGAMVITLHLGICVTLIAAADHRRKFSTLFTTFINHSKIPNRGWAFLYSWSLSAVALGTEPSAHMAEETKHAASTVPRAMFCSVVFSAILGMFSNIATTLTLIPIHHPLTKTWPIIDLLFSHLPKPAALLVLISLLIILTVQGISQMLAATRFTWALARDGVIPYSSYWHKVTPETRIPRRATCLLIVLGMLGATTYADDTAVLANMMIQLTALLIAGSYIVPVALYLSSPHGILDYDGRNVWTLRQFGRPLAAISMAFLILEMILYSSPSTPHPNKRTWAYGPFLLVAIVLLCSISWVLYGRVRYIGPIKSLTVWSAGQELEIPKITNRTNLGIQETVTTAPRIIPETLADPSCASPSMTNPHNLPSAYQTYGTDGSLWCGTNLQLESLTPEHQP